MFDHQTFSTIRSDFKSGILKKTGEEIELTHAKSKKKVTVHHPVRVTSFPHALSGNLCVLPMDSRLMHAGMTEGSERAQKKADFAFRRVFYLPLAGMMMILFLISPSVTLADGPASVISLTPNRLIIPAIALDSQVVSVGAEIVVLGNNRYLQWTTSNNLVGWHNLSAQMGQVGNTVMTGHSDIYARIFRNLRYVAIGDEIIVMSGGIERRYQVSQRVFVRERGASIAERVANGRFINPTTDERLTLVTCANPGATHRLIVVAHPINW